MEITRIYIDGTMEGRGINGVSEMFIDTTDEIDPSKPFLTVTGVKNVPEYGWARYDGTGRYADKKPDRWMKEAIENPRRYVVSTAHIAFIEYWERELKE